MSNHRTPAPEWETLGSQLIVDNPYVRLRRDKVRLPDSGITLDWYVIEGTDSASIFALTPAREVVLVRLYRHAIGRRVYELPSGGIETAQSPAETAIAELAEETGWRANAVEELGCFEFQPAHTGRRMHVFYTDTVTPGPRIGTELAEAGIETVLVTIPRLVELLQTGEIMGMPSALAIYHVLTVKNLWPAAR